MEDRIGKWFKVNWRGAQRVALVKAWRVDPEDPKAEKHIYYCHFHGTDSRLDSWIPAVDILSQVNEPSAPPSASPVAGSPASIDALSKKRKHNADLPAAGYSSASNPTTALQPRTISTVYFGDYRMKAWYHSPYPIEDLLREMPLNKAKASTPAPPQAAAPAAASTSATLNSTKGDKSKGILNNTAQTVPTAQMRSGRPQRKAAANALAQSEQRTRASKRLNGARSSVEPPGTATSAQVMPEAGSNSTSRSGTPSTHSPHVTTSRNLASSSSATVADSNFATQRSASTAAPVLPQMQVQSGQEDTPSHSPLRLKGGGKRRRQSSSPPLPRLTPSPDANDWMFRNPNNGRLMKPYNPFGDTTSESSSETEEEDFKPGDNKGKASTSAVVAQSRSESQPQSAVPSTLQGPPVTSAVEEIMYPLPDVPHTSHAPKASTSANPDPQAAKPPRPASNGQAEPTVIPTAKKKQEPIITDATLYVCEACFKYFVHDAAYVRHKAMCKHKAPPGEEIYNSTVHSMWEVDGAKAKLYCQNLCLFGKLFIDHKYVFFDTAPFLFYIMTERRPGFNHVLGFFSKEKVSYNDYNLACIVTVPPYQKNGFGRFMIEFSYELSAMQSNSRRAGTPERPLSDLGLRTYLQFWTAVLVRWFRLIFYTRNDPRLAATFTDTKEDRSLKAAAQGLSNSQTEIANGTSNLKLLNGLPAKSNASPSKQSKGKQFQTRYSVAEIARATNLREDDVAFALVHSGLAKFRAPAPAMSDGIAEDAVRVEGASGDDLELIIAPGLVEDVAKRFKVADPFIRFNGFKIPSARLQELVTGKKSSETAAQQK